MEQIDIIIRFFGGLKTFYSDSISLQLAKGISVNEVIDKLLELNSEAQEVLDISQLAIDSTIVPKDFIITEKCELIVLPPFSGG
ncbi:MAG: MoaD/ThiS family protein [Paludibacter sp.]|nr:MoaD/ThiS family protein [Paludibacter sp.]